MSSVEPDPAGAPLPSPGGRTWDKRTVITRGKLLVVEGTDDFEFFRALLLHLGLLDGVQILNAAGVGNLPRYLRALPATDGFYTVPVTSLGTIRDADQNAGLAFASTQQILANVSLSVPTRPLISAGSDPKILVFILPDCSSPGMLETLCLQAVRGDPAVPCLEQYFDCVQLGSGTSPENRDKAMLHAFLASRPRYCPLLGHGAHAGHLRWESPVYDSLKGFLRAL